MTGKRFLPGSLTQHTNATVAPISQKPSKVYIRASWLYRTEIGSNANSNAAIQVALRVATRLINLMLSKTVPTSATKLSDLTAKAPSPNKTIQ